MLIIENITKKYNSKINNETVALKNVNLSFMNKEMIFILGPSGCGKTTLMNIIGGLDIPSNGVVKINNTCIGTSEEEIDVYRSNYIGFIFQNFNLIDNLSIYDNLLLVCYNKNDEKMISYYLEKVGLKDYEDRFPNELSGGQVQRVAIARALLKKSDILLADEPTGNLNEELSAEIFNLLKNISKDKLVIVTTHNKEMANLYADRIIEMNDGVIVTDKVVAPKSNELLIEKRNDNTISSKKILKLAVRNFKTSKLDIMFNLIILLLSFICSALTFSIANYNRVDTDVKNLKKMNEIETFSLERYSYNDELGRYVSYAQIEEIKK